YLGGSRDAINNEGFAQINGLLTLNTGPGGVVTTGKLINNSFVQSTSISDANQSGLYLHNLDFRIYDINLVGGQRELIADYQFLKGGIYHFSNGMDPLNIGDTSGGRGGFFYFHPFGGSNRFEVRKILKSAWGQPSTASETATGSTPPPPSP